MMDITPTFKHTAPKVAKVSVQQQKEEAAREAARINSSLSLLSDEKDDGSSISSSRKGTDKSTDEEDDGSSISSSRKGKDKSTLSDEDDDGSSISSSRKGKSDMVDERKGTDKSTDSKEHLRRRRNDSDGDEKEMLSICQMGHKQGEKVNDEESSKKNLGDVVRNKEDRRKLLHGYSCRCCHKYYDALELPSADKKDRINAVSRHRGVQPLPPTPDRYWEVVFPTSHERRKRGLTQIESPYKGLKPKGVAFGRRSRSGIMKKLFR